MSSGMASDELLFVLAAHARVAVSALSRSKKRIRISMVLSFGREIRRIKIFPVNSDCNSGEGFLQ